MNRAFLAFLFSLSLLDTGFANVNDFETVKFKTISQGESIKPLSI